MVDKILLVIAGLLSLFALILSGYITYIIFQKNQNGELWVAVVNDMAIEKFMSHHDCKEYENYLRSLAFNNDKFQYSCINFTNLAK